MKTLAKIFALAGIVLTSYGTYAQSKGDTILSSKTSSVVEEVYNKDKKVLEKREYIIEKNSQEKDGKILLETEKKYSFKEKDLGRPTDPKEPKNILNRKLTDKCVDYWIATEYKYDSLNRAIEIEKTEDLSIGEGKKTKTKTYFTYEGADKAPVKIWEDLNNDGKYNQGDKIKVYVKDLDKWVSQGE